MCGLEVLGKLKRSGESSCIAFERREAVIQDTRTKERTIYERPPFIPCPSVWHLLWTLLIWREYLFPKVPSFLCEPRARTRSSHTDSGRIVWLPAHVISGDS